MYLYTREGSGQFLTTLQPHNPKPGSGYVVAGRAPSAVEGLGQPSQPARSVFDVQCPAPPGCPPLAAGQCRPIVRQAIREAITRICADFSGGQSTSQRYVIVGSNWLSNDTDVFDYGGYTSGPHFSYFGTQCGSLSIVPSGTPRPTVSPEARARSSAASGAGRDVRPHAEQAHRAPPIAGQGWQRPCPTRRHP